MNKIYILFSLVIPVTVNCFFLDCSDFSGEEDRIRVQNDTLEIIRILQITTFPKEEPLYAGNKLYRDLAIGATTDFKWLSRDDNCNTGYGLKVRSSTDSGLSHNKDINFDAEPDKAEVFLAILKQDGSVEVKKD